MKTYPQYAENNKLCSFEIENTLCSRKKTTNIVRRISGVHLLRQPKRIFSWFREDVFCEFVLDGVHFTIDEPFGDSSRFWIGASEKENSGPIEKIFEAFNNV